MAAARVRTCPAGKSTGICRFQSSFNNTRTRSVPGRRASKNGFVPGKRPMDRNRIARPQNIEQFTANCVDLIDTLLDGFDKPSGTCA
jgi:hypothetical protein